VTTNERVAHTRSGPSVIAIVGIDGAGKTTQAQRLAEWLSDNGHPADYWQNAGGRRWFGRLARRVGARDEQALFGVGGMLLIEAVLRWLAIARALVRSRLRQRIAIMDRYSWCQYASIRAHSASLVRAAGLAPLTPRAHGASLVRAAGLAPRAHGASVAPNQARRARRREWLARFMYRLYPDPDLTCFLAVSPGQAYARIEARGTDHEDLAYLEAADAAYRALPEAGRFVVIDANRSPDDVQHALRAAVEDRLSGRDTANTAHHAPDTGGEILKPTAGTPIRGT
jgi:thymidylate kinase